MQLDQSAQPHVRGLKLYSAHLYFHVIFAIVCGALIVQFYPKTGETLKPRGDGFIKLLKMIIVLVIFLTIVTGLAGISTLRGVGAVVENAFGYFLTFFTWTLVVGLTAPTKCSFGLGGTHIYMTWRRCSSFRPRIPICRCNSRFCCCWWRCCRPRARQA